MATHQQAIDAGTALRDALHTAAGDGSLGTHRDDFATLHGLIARNLAAFTLDPKHGDTSPRYDSFVQKAQRATGLVQRANPGAPPTIQRALSESQAANDALSPITGSAPAAASKAGFLGALRGSLRIARDQPARTVAKGTAGMATKSITKADVAVGATTSSAERDPNYYQKLVNLFPAEAVSLYGTGAAIFGLASLPVILICLLVLVVLRLFATQPEQGGPPQTIAVAVAAISFLLWATALDPQWLSWAIGTLPANASAAQVKQHAAVVSDIKKYAAFIGAAWVFVAPLLIRPKAARAS
jgi:hypothetical protein